MIGRPQAAPALYGLLGRFSVWAFAPSCSAGLVAGAAALSASFHASQQRSARMSKVLSATHPKINQTAKILYPVNGTDIARRIIEKKYFTSRATASLVAEAKYQYLWKNLSDPTCL